MKSLRYFLLVPSLVLIIAFDLSAQSKAGLIDSLLNTAHDRGFFNGNALVAEKGKVVYQNEIGYADASRDKKLTSDLRFSIGSISKEFDGVAIMLLKEQGKLSFSDKISNFFPELPEWATKISVKNLMHYTSGLPSPDYQKVRTDAQVWTYLQNLKNLEFEPGTDYGYNNVNVFFRKRIVEKVSGRNYANFITAHILQPCGMTNAVIDPTGETTKTARSFDNHFVQDDMDTYMSGWVYMTAQDLYKWIQCFHSDQLINRTSRYELFESFEPSSQSPLGHVVFENGNLQYQYHHGQNDNFEASLYYNSQDDYTVILLTNNRNSNVGDLTNAIDAILRGEPFKIPKKSIEMTLRTEIFYNGFEKGMQLFADISKNERSIYDFENEENELLETGEFLLEKNRPIDGLKVLKFTVEKFPNSSQASITLAEAYYSQGKEELALHYFEEAYELNPQNSSVQRIIESLRSGS